MADEPDRPDPTAPEPIEWSARDATPSTATRASRRRSRRRGRRRGVVLAVGSAALLAIGGAAAALALTGSGSPKPAAHRARRPVTTLPTTTPTTIPGPTTVVPRSSNPNVALAQQYDGVYVGTYTNVTEHTSGAATLELRIDPNAATLAVNLALTGDLYGAEATTQVHSIQGTIQLSNPSAPVVMQTTNFGRVTGQLAGLSIVLTAPDVPNPQVHTFQLNGELRSDHKGFDATFMIGYRDGRTAQGTASVFCSVTGNRPSQVGTLCANA
ncbi:MAG TPA: hypothetical protein VGU73_04370 [Acidimicrobiia bacterium]|nr:hypothetical protein [Acidimicrobiia bacterium]